jgi:adenosylmethionine-8-amino-7-oxononanoate aminotransferase
MGLSERDSNSVWHPYTQRELEGLPLPLKNAKGSLLFDEKGNSYIDAISSWWVNLHGHSNPDIIRAINETVSELDQVIFAGFTHEPAVKLAENILSATHKDNGKVFFSDDGSTAVEAALKMAIQYWSNRGKSKKKFIAFEGAYHGDTFGSMSVSARGVYNSPFNECLFEVDFIKLPVGNVEESISALKTFLKNEDVAAFIFEPLVQGASGMKMYPAKALDALMDICRENEILTIADEVFTGFFRTGKMLACDYLLNKPDIYCFSKGLSGGVLPLGATAASNSIFEAFLSEKRQKMFLHGHSYTANPISCAAANASFDLLFSAQTQNNINIISRSHLEFLEVLKSHPRAINPRAIGTILALEVRTESNEGYLNSLRDKLYKFYLENGVLLRPLGNTIYVIPPYCIQSEELEKVYTVIYKSLDEIDG